MPEFADDEYRLVAVDLFCGGGGFTTGFVREVVRRYRGTIAEETGLDEDEIGREHPQVQQWLGENVYLVGVNHWDPACETFEANHPWARVFNSKVQALHPPRAITVDVDGEEKLLKVDVLIAGPSCIPWSKAKGGMADDDQLRMSPDHVKHWLGLLRPDHFMLENVEGFTKWGPMYDDPETGERKMRKDGSMFEQWIENLRALGYSVAYDTFYAHEYGDPQSRKRLFVQGRLNYDPAWPEPTHGPEADQACRTAAEVVDWSDPGGSIWTRDEDHPRVHNGPKYKTMRRIAQGILRNCHESFEPYAEALRWIGRVSQRDQEKHDVEPGDFRTVAELREDAVPVKDVHDAVEERDEPFLVKGKAVAADGGESEPRHGLCVPCVLGQHGGAVPRDATEEPCPTVATGGAISVIGPEPMVLPRNGRQRDHFSNGAYPPEDEPLHTVTAHNHDGHLVSPYLVPFYSERDGQAPRTHDVEEPLPTVPASEIKQGLVSPFFVEYNGESTVADVDEPLPTVTATDRHALVVPEAYPWGLDIRFRMLKPSELKQAQGFPESYELAADTKKHRTKLIGNSVPVGLAQSLCRSLLDPTDAPTLNNYAEGPQPTAGADGGATSDD